MNEPKFKAGDKVRIVCDRDHLLPNFPEELLKTDLEILEHYSGNWYKIKEYELTYPLGDIKFHDSCFQLVEELAQSAIQAEIEELKKPKYNLFRISPGEKCYSMILLGGGLYDRFETLQSAEYYARGMRIYTTLANFADHNDLNEKHKNWNGENLHYYIKFGTNTKFYYVENSDHWRNPTVIYFSTKELAEAALDMLKRKGLI